MKAKQKWKERERQRRKTKVKDDSLSAWPHHWTVRRGRARIRE